MASSNNGGGGGGREEEQIKKMAELSKTLKEGERILAPTRRPDGTLRKPIRIRAGYVPQDEVAIYQSRGALWKKEMQSQQLVPPGYDPITDAKPKTKSVKRNERKKEKRLQAALEKGKLEASGDKDMKREEVLPDEHVSHASESVKSLTSQMNELDVCANVICTQDSQDSADAADQNSPAQDIDKRIRALKKKIRQAEAQQQKTPSQDMKPEQLEKLAKLEDWHQELKLLEGKKSQIAAS